MTGDELNHLYGAMIMPDARVDVPDNWMPIVHRAMKSIVDLPGEVRMFAIVVGICRDANDDLTFEVACAADYVTPEGLGLIRAITDRAAAEAKQGGLH